VAPGVLQCNVRVLGACGHSMPQRPASAAEADVDAEAAQRGIADGGEGLQLFQELGSVARRRRGEHVCGAQIIHSQSCLVRLRLAAAYCV
jgi:hypothetical protein